MTRMSVVLSAVVVAAVAGGALAYKMMSRGTDRFTQCRASSVAGAGAIGGPFTLVNSAGQAVTDADVITEPSLVYFGYTFCPDVCPLDMSRNAEAVDILAERGISATPVFITIDPERDTPEVVGAYADAMHERAIGLTGSAEQIKAVSQEYKTYYKAQRQADDPYYLVDHSTFTYLVLPDYGFVDFFRRDLTPTQIADHVGCFVKES